MSIGSLESVIVAANVSLFLTSRSPFTIITIAHTICAGIVIPCWTAGYRSAPYLW